MSPLIALAVIGGLVGIAVVAGVLWSRRGATITTGDARRDTHDSERLDPVTLAAAAGAHASGGAAGLGETATIVQFSTVYCTRCPATHRLITELAAERPGVEVLHLDVTEAPDLVAEYRLRQTPTVLIVDAEGATRSRLSGAISRADLTAQLAALEGVHA